MKIHVLSDLHLEFAPFDSPETDANVLVLAGDIGARNQGLHWAKKTFPNIPIIYVIGNHEFYSAGKLNNVIADMRLTARELSIFLLEHNAVVIDGVRFLGATLWTDFKLFGEAKAELAQLAAWDRVADFTGAIWSFTPPASVVLHERAVEWLAGELAKPFNGPTVVVTHHAPARGSIHPSYAQDELCAAFVSDVSLVRPPVDLWIHGHCHHSFNYCHDSFNYGVNGTRVVCNPRGYPLAGGGNENPDFNPGLIVEV